MVPTRATPGAARLAAIVLLLLNGAAVAFAFHLNRDALLEIVFDPGDPDVPTMRGALTSYAGYAAAIVALAGAGLVVALDAARARWPARVPRWLRDSVTVVWATALGVFAYVDLRVFSDYGVHTYDFDVLGVVFNTVLSRDLGIRPMDIVLAVGGGVAIIGVEIAALVALRRGLARLDARITGRLAAGAIAGLGVVAGLGLTRHHALAGRVAAANRAELDEVMPFRAILLASPRARPHIRVAPRLTAGGYPVVGSHGVVAPRLARPRNLVFFVPDGLRADIAADEAESMRAFGARPDVIAPRRAYSTGHTTDNGVFGLFYGVNGYDFYPFLEARVNPYPLAVLRANGYVTALIAGSGFAPTPTDHLLRIFDEVTYPTSDDDVARQLRAFVAARRADGKPYLVMAFYYATHWPFPAHPAQQRYHPTLDDRRRAGFSPMQDSAFRAATRNSARNGARQADAYFRDAFAAIADDYAAGRTALLVTADHGTDMWEHGVFGHGRPSFWNGKFEVPFFLGLPGVEIAPARRTPALASHLDLWPTLFEYLGADPRPDPGTYSDGLSLLSGDPAALEQRGLFLTGRFFPWADRPNALVVGDRKYWFTTARPADGIEQLTFQITRVTDARDGPIAMESEPDSAADAAFAALQNRFWRFLRPAGRTR